MNIQSWERLKKRIWKTVVALSVFASLFSSVGISLGWWPVFFVGGSMILTVYWHFIEELETLFEKIKRLEKTERDIILIKKDITFIKTKIRGNKR